MIALEQVSVERGGRALVSEVSFTIKPGALTAILGANGAGKTSLVRLMSGEWTPTRGRVRWEGRALSELDRTALARRRAVLSQQYAIPFAFRALDLVLMGRLPHTWHPGERDRAIAREAMERAGVASFAQRRVDTLSGGERQRVHFARALAQLHEARIARRGALLLDEPTAHLDLAHQGRALELARRLAGEGLAVAAVLHDINLAAAYADCVVLLKAGRVVASGPAEAVLVRPLLRQAYGVDLTALAFPNRPPVFIMTNAPDLSCQETET